MEDNHCYICLDPCDEASQCRCEAPAHHRCFYKFALSTETTECSICKTPDQRFSGLQQLLDREYPETPAQPIVIEQTTDYCKFSLCCISFTSVIAFFLSFDEDGQFVVLSPLAYLFIVAVSIPLSSICTGRKHRLVGTPTEPGTPVRNPMQPQLRELLRPQSLPPMAQLAQP